MSETKPIEARHWSAYPDGERNKGGNRKARLARLVAKLKAKVKAKK